LEAIVPTLAVPIQPLLEGLDRQPYSMFRDYWKYDWVLEIQRYQGVDELIASANETIIRPAEQKLESLMARKT
jgi:hypothetical protein